MTIAKLAGILGIALASHACVQSSGLPEPVPATGDDLRGVTYREITLTRSGCLGTCPIYTVVYRRDGTVTYTGVGNVDYIGERVGQMSVADFAELARFVEQAGFADLRDSYRQRDADAPTITVTITHVDGHSKTVTDYGPVGPPKLWALHRVIDGLLVQVRWNNKNAG